MKRFFKLFILLLSMAGLSQSAVARDDAEIQVSVTVSNQLAAERFSQNWPVHIYLAAPGSRASLSYTISQLDRLPLSLTLTEHHQVLPTLSLKGLRELVLIAKVSSSGDPHVAGAEDYRQISPVFRLDAQQQATVNMVLQE